MLCLDLLFLSCKRQKTLVSNLRVLYTRKVKCPLTEMSVVPSFLWQLFPKWTSGTTAIKVNKQQITG